MKKFSILAILTLALSAPALAAGPYFDVFVGFGETDDTDFAVNGTSRIDTEFDNNFAYGATFGYAFDNQWRVEGEITRREADVDSHSLDGSAPIDGSSGDLNATSLFANVYYDFQTQSRVTPYVGVGVGTVKLDFVDFGVPGLDALDDDDDVLGYQAIAGLAVKINDRVQFRSDVRYMTADDAEVTSSAATGSTPGEAPYSALDLTLGLRFTF